MLITGNQGEPESGKEAAEIQQLINRAKQLRASNLDESESLLRQAITLARERSILALEAKAQELVSDTLGKAGRFDFLLRAKELGKALILYRKLKDDAGQARILISMGNNATNTADYAEALDSLHEAEDICKRLGDLSLSQKVIGQLFGVHTDLGNFETALSYANRGLELAAGSDDPMIQMFAISQLGCVLGLMGKHEQGVAKLREAQYHIDKIATDARSRGHFQAQIFADLSEAFLNWGKPEEALANAEEGARIASQIGHQPLVQLNGRYAGRAALASGNPALALKRLQLALEFTRKNGLKAQESKIQFELSQALAELGRYEEALELHREAHRMEGKIRRNEAARRIEFRRVKQDIDDAKRETENAERILKESEVRNREVTEALEQQTATAEILKIIASSPSDVQPVFDAIIHNAVRLGNADFGSFLQVTNGILKIGAHFNIRPEMEVPLGAEFPLDRNSIFGRAVLDRTVINVADYADSDIPGESRNRAKELNIRGSLAVPTMRHGEPIGAIAIGRCTPGAFSDKHLAMVKAFADQAVIAIENVRLFNETNEALERQTATAEILKVIASSPSDVQPVFDAIAESAKRLFAGRGAAVTRVLGDMIHLAAFTATDEKGDELLKSSFPQPLSSRGSEVARLGKPMYVVDHEIDPEVSPESRMLARARGYRSQIVVPMLREGVVVGSISVTRPEPGMFTGHQISLLETFADQAVIAIENVRLFNETKEALEQQTAISEILSAISSSPTDVQPVLDAVAVRALQLCEGGSSAVYLRDGEILRRVAVHGPLVFQGSGLTVTATPLSVSGRAVSEARTIHVHDIGKERTRYPASWEMLQQFAETPGISLNHTMLVVPLLKDGVAIGDIFVRRGEVRPFSDKQIALVQTFAAQAVIAIENVRLFHEIQDKSAQLETASRHKSEFLANMSHELRTPLNAILGFSEVLIEKMFGGVNDKQLDYLKDINSSGQHLLSLINDILDLSKIEAGKMELQLSEFDLPSALQTAVTLIKERAQRHGIHLDLEIAAGVGNIHADERKLKQIMLNLLSNAVKFTPDGGSIFVKAKRESAMVEVSVTDTGAGIASEDHAAVFEEFRQVGSDTARKAEGTGLGMPLTKRFVELHGGEIRLESALGKGSTFTFMLPMT